MIAIRAVASAPFLWLEYRRPGFPEDSYGFDLAERMRLGSYGLDYVTNLAPEDYLAKATTGPANTPAFLQSEIQHMHDVKRVLLFATIAVAVFCVLALIGSISLKERAPRHYSPQPVHRRLGYRYYARGARYHRRHQLGMALYRLPHDLLPAGQLAVPHE